MTTLRSKLIHLAQENPALRPQLLPLLKEAAPTKGVDVAKAIELGALAESYLNALQAAQKKLSVGRDFYRALEAFKLPGMQSSSSPFYSVALVKDGKPEDVGDVDGSLVKMIHTLELAVKELQKV